MTATTLTQHQARGHALAEKLIEFLQTSKVPDGLHPPGRHGEVAEHVGREQAVRHFTGLKELDELLSERVGAGLVLRGGHGGHADAPAAARLAPTTVMVALSGSVGLNSTISVPAVMTGVCPAGA